MIKFCATGPAIRGQEGDWRTHRLPGVRTIPTGIDCIV